MIRLRRAEEREHDRKNKRDAWLTFCPGGETLDEDRLAPGAGVPLYHALRRRDRHLRP